MHGCLHARFCLAIRLAMTGVAGQVSDVPRSAEVRKFCGTELWAIVTDHLVWNAITGEVTLQLENGGTCLSIWQPVYFPKVAEVIYHD